MSEPLRNLDGPCGTCGRPAGDHTLREWSACMGAVATDLPYEDFPPDAAAMMADVRRRFALRDGVIVADSVVVRAAVLEGAAGAVSVKCPALIHEFQVSTPGKPPTTVAEVVFVGNSDSVRGYGRLVRDSANGAVRAAERA